jgi:transposase
MRLLAAAGMAQLRELWLDGGGCSLGSSWLGQGCSRWPLQRGLALQRCDATSQGGVGCHAAMVQVAVRASVIVPLSVYILCSGSHR